MSKRYVDADALIKDLESRRLVFKNTIRVADALRTQGRVMREAIEEAPTADVVEVVRCRECKYCHHYVTPTLERYECYYNGCSDENVNYVEPTHYCAYGERREQCDT